MSLVIQTMIDGQYHLMCKGADSIVLPRCLFTTPKDKEVERTTIQNLYGFAVEGLRTLVMGKKALTNEQYQAFANEYQNLKTSTDKNKED